MEKNMTKNLVIAAFTLLASCIIAFAMCTPSGSDTGSATSTSEDTDFVLSGDAI